MSVLLHVGYAKAASTTLQDWFDRHPEIWRFSMKTLVKGLAVGKKLCVLSDERLSLGLVFDSANGLITVNGPIKEFQRNRCLELKGLFPNSHVLIVTRGFSQFILSFYGQYVSKGGILSFANFVEVYKDVITDLVDYNYLINIYRYAFGERVIVLPVELLRSDAETFYGIIERRLGLSVDKRPKLRRLNWRLNRRLIRALPYISRIYLRLSRGLSQASQRAMHKLFVAYVARGRLGVYLSYIIPTQFLESPPPSNFDVSRLSGLADILAPLEIYAPFKADYLLTNSGNYAGAGFENCTS